MSTAVRAILRGLNNMRLSGYAYIWGNFAFILLSVPLITLPAAWSALVRVGHASHTQASSADLELFWDTFKSNLLRALPWGIFMAGFGIINASNLLAYRNVDSTFIRLLQVFWVMGAVLWLGIALFTWTIYYEMENPTVFGATRNAAVMTLYNPFFTITIIIGIVLLMVVSTILLAMWLVLTFGAISAVANAAALDRIEAYRLSRVSGS